MVFSDVTLPGKLSLSGGWGLTQWEEPPEEKTTTPSPTSQAITTPVTRTVVDDSENFFSAFLSPLDAQGANQRQIVSVPPAKSQRKSQEKQKEKDDDCQILTSTEESSQSETVAEKQLVENGPPPSAPHADTAVEQQLFSVSSSCDTLHDPESKLSSEKTNVISTVSLDLKAEESQISVQQDEQDTTDSSEPSPAISELKSSSPSGPSSSASSKEVLLEQKDSKAEDRQNDTPSPPVSAFSSGTSTTSDIEVLDHESVLSESSASSRQENGDSKAGLHLMQGSFQLLSASTCGDFPRLEDYPKLTESCGSSSDAFERIDSFSVQSLDSRSVSEVNSDDEIPGSRTLAAVTAGAGHLTVSPAVCQKQEDEVVENVEKEEEEGLCEVMMEHTVDEMEESGRSATPVNTEQPEELMEWEPKSETSVTLSESFSNSEKHMTPPITEEMKSVSTVQILELQKVSTTITVN